MSLKDLLSIYLPQPVSSIIEEYEEIFINIKINGDIVNFLESDTNEGWKIRNNAVTLMITTHKLYNQLQKLINGQYNKILDLNEYKFNIEIIKYNREEYICFKQIFPDGIYTSADTDLITIIFSFVMTLFKNSEELNEVFYTERDAFATGATVLKSFMNLADIIASETSNYNIDEDKLVFTVIKLIKNNTKLVENSLNNIVFNEELDVLRKLYEECI